MSTNTVKLTIRISRETYERLRREAQECNVSLNRWINYLVERHLGFDPEEPRPRKKKLPGTAKAA